MVIIHHSRDLDGYSSGAICKLKYPDAKLIGYDYNQPIPWDKIPEGEEVIMIDVSLSMPDMEKLAIHCKHLTWYDHHISAIDDFFIYFSKKVNELKREELELSCGGGGLIVQTPTYKITTKLQVGIAACEIAWEDLFAGELIPKAIKLLGEYDTWRKSDIERWENEILPFQFGMRMLCTSPETFPKDFLSSGISMREIEPTIEDGQLILNYQRQNNERACRSSFEIIFEELRAICLNAGGVNSDAFKSVYDEDKHDIMIPFSFNGREWNCSIYSTKKDIDCSAIAKKYGGGGHFSASGMKLSNAQFKALFNI